MSNRFLTASLAFVATWLPLASVNPKPAAAWSPQTTMAIAEQALILAPPHLSRQLERHKGRFRDGVMAPYAQPGGTKQGLTLAPEVLRTALDREAQNTIEAIEGHVPFEEVIFRLGFVASYAASANDPLLGQMSSESRPPWAADYPAYVESAFPRFSVVFYGAGRQLESQEDLDHLIESAYSRSRGIRPLLSLEYTRIGIPNGVELFDDRSTAFGISSMAFSQAVSDVVAIMRYIWLGAGGIDSNHLLPMEEDRLILLKPGGEQP
jgi:hypothetical protein